MSDTTSAIPIDGAAPDIPYQAIIEQSLVGIYILQDERFVWCNATWSGLVGYSVAEMVGMHLRDLVDPEFLDTVLSRYYQRLHNDPPSMRFQTRGLHRDGHLVHIEIHGTRMMYRGRPAVVGVGIDISERVAQDEALRRSREQLQELTAYTTRKLEDQRLTFARDVHDELGGMLTALKMDATRVMRRAHDGEMRELTQGLLDLTQKTIETVKQISESLRPSALDHVGLAVAITRDLQAFGERSGVAYGFNDASADGRTLRLPPRRANAVYRIFHEGLTNVARHANARRVDVELAEDGDFLVMRLADDGTGFTPSVLDRGSLGLLSMSERARETGGELQIDAAPGRGTCLVLKVPLL